MFTRTQILEQLIGTEAALPPEVARYFLGLNFPESAKARFVALSERAQLGTLTDDERVELEELLSFDAFLMIVQSKARLSLRANNPAA